jgi:hypothetical protein
MKEGYPNILLVPRPHSGRPVTRNGEVNDVS